MSHEESRPEPVFEKKKRETGRMWTAPDSSPSSPHRRSAGLVPSQPDRPHGGPAALFPRPDSVVPSRPVRLAGSALPLWSVYRQPPPHFGAFPEPTSIG